MPSLVSISANLTTVSSFLYSRPVMFLSKVPFPVVGLIIIRRLDSKPTRVLPSKDKPLKRLKPVSAIRVDSPVKDTENKTPNSTNKNRLLTGSNTMSVRVVVGP